MSEDSKIEVKGGKLRTTLNVAAVVLLGYAVLWADRHNDSRYVSREEYRKDRANDERASELTQKLVTQRADQTDKKLDELSGDMKALLRRTSISFENHPPKLTP